MIGRRRTKGETSKNSNRVSSPSSSANRVSLRVLPAGGRKKNRWVDGWIGGEEEKKKKKSVGD